jgi:tetratricopeptide (TPR) repeat protein
MKKLILFLSFWGVTNAWAQQSNVQSAARSLSFEPIRYTDLVNAKKSIDLAAESESTSNDPKMWYYRGKVYYMITGDSAAKANNLDPQASEKAVASFVNCIKTDTKKNHYDDTKNLVWQSAIGLFNKAVNAYANNDPQGALRMYDILFGVFPLDPDNNLKRNNITPDILYKNMYFAANKAGDKGKAKEYVQKLMDNRFNDPKIYLWMSRLNLEQSDTAQAIASIEKGRAIFDDNSSLMNEEIRLYLLTGKTEVLIEKLATSIESTPDNENLYLTRASLYEGKKDYDKAAADYKKTLELNPDQLYANYNLGIMYFNQGADMANKANAITDMAKFDKAKGEFEAKFKSAQPYLEKAKEVNPRKTEDDQTMYKTTLQTLKVLYARLNMLDKSGQIKGELEKL